MKKTLAILAIIAIGFGAYYFFNSRTDSDAPAVPGSANAGLIESSWSWQYTDLLNGERITSPAGDRYILSFDGNGRVSSLTDCNGMSGIYIQDGEVLSMGQFAMTEMYCEGSQDTVYAQQLSLVNSYVIDGDNLRFNLNRDFGTMYFVRK